MGAIVQTILKPTRARGLDTSSGEQIVGNQLLGDPSFDTAVAEADNDTGEDSSRTGTYWKVSNHDLAITGGKAVWTAYSGSQSRRLQDNVDGPFADVTARYRVSVTVSDYTSGELKFVTGSYNSGFVIDSVKTYVFDMSPETGGGNFHLDASTDAVLSVSDVAIYKLESFGNNNHAQIYSGRGLEFDGVTDYLNVSGSSSHVTFVDYTAESTAANRAWTVAVWFNFDAVGTANQHLTGYDDSQDTAVSNYLRISSNEKLAFYDLGGGAGREANTTLNTNTWYRAVFVYNGSDTINFYLNGVADGSGTLTAGNNNNADLNIGLIGAKLSSSVFGGAFAGKMSDFQAWQGAWTAADAEYDYLNPEQLALNRGGTSLTNSNLKLWYPMNEGHRGNQSYVLDASNTGLGDDVFTNGDFATGDLTGWTISGTVTYSNGGMRLVEDGFCSAYQAVGVSGTTYKLTYDVIAIDTASGGSQLQVQQAGIQINMPGTQFGDSLDTHSIYFTADRANIEIKRSGSDLDVTIDNLILEPINAKNNAKTAFYGDELVENESFDTADDWTAQSGWTVSGNGVATVDSSVPGGTTNLTSDGMAVVVGRTYAAEMYVDSSSGTGIRFDLGGVSSGSYGNTTGLVEAPIVATSTAGFSITATGSDTTSQISRVSVKETGTATGWTNADQQLDIPQTALQSYNQLAMFNTNDIGGTGENTYVAFSDGDSVHNVTTANHSWSFWYMPDIANDTGYLVQKGGHNVSGWYIFLTNGAVQYQTNQDGENQPNLLDSDLTVGVWSHVVVVVSDSGTESNIYINGEFAKKRESHIAPATHTSNMNFMCYQGTNNPLNGCITEISAWSSSLSATEITELYNEGLALDATTHSGSSNLKGYWRNNGLSQWDDLSSNSINGTPTNITETMLITAGVDGSRDSQGFLMNRQRTTNSLNLYNNNGMADGDWTHALVPSSGDDALAFVGVGDAFSVSCWVKVRHLPSTNQMIISRNDNTDGWRMMIDTANKIQFNTEDSTAGIQTAITDSAISVDTWYHLVGTFDGDPSDNGNGVLKLYLNGSNSGITNDTDAVDMDASSSKDHIYIGMHQSSNSEGFFGEIDDIAIYNDVLSLPEVTRNYNAGKRSHR